MAVSQDGEKKGPTKKYRPTSRREDRHTKKPQTPDTVKESDTVEVVVRKKVQRTNTSSKKEKV